MAQKRFLRPHFLVPLDGVLWVLDESQPVAALVEPITGTVLQLVDWRDLAAPPPDEPAHVVGDETQLWIQPGVHQDGVIGRVDADGLRQVAEVGGTTLCAAGHGAAWCVDGLSPDPGRSSHDGAKPVPAPLREGQLVVVDTTGRTRTITVDRPVAHAEPRPDGLYLEVHADLPTAHPVGQKAPVRAWSFEYHRVQLRLPWNEPLPDHITCDQHPWYEPGTARPSRRNHGGVGGWLSWHRTHDVTGNGLAAGELRWALGPLRRQVNGDRYPIIATGHDPDDGSERVRIDLGTGRSESATECADQLWATLCRAPHPCSGRPLELVRIDPATQRVDTVLHSEQVDITDRCWPLVSLPDEQIAAHAEHQHARFDRTTRSLREVSEVHCELDGCWPDLGVRVHFRHPYLPGGWLTRRWPLFDELGRPLELRHDNIYLMEDLDCRLLPPTEAARDGVLEI